MSQSSIRYEWNEINWRRLEKYSFKLQKRIYQASQCNNIKLVHSLQKLLLSSKSAKLLAVRKVTQDNNGRKTAGIDGVASVPQKERLNLAKTLNLDSKSKPVRRIWIPKPGKQEKRPLGIPTISDRAKQALIKMAMEPEWEAKFEPNSYGFRPGRSCHDAYEAIFKALNRKTAFVLDADISKCFDNIDHNVLLTKLKTTSRLRYVIKGWLKAGIMEGNILHKTESGTPQGGVISPLLANIALHGMEYYIKEALADELFQHKKDKFGKAAHMHAQKTLSLIKYADDFVIMHESKEIVQKAKLLVEEWLLNIGLELNYQKSSIVHTLKEVEGRPAGFNFLGFNVKQYADNNDRKKYILLIKPSSESQKRHKHTIKEKLRSMRGLSQATVIKVLNPIIKGWSKYYVPAVSRKVFERLDHEIHIKLWKWALYRHPHRGQRWIKRKYFRYHENDRWRFKTHKNEVLVRHTDYHIKRHVKVIGTRSPYDGGWVYWSTRLGRSPMLSPRVAKLLKLQQGKCRKCNNWFKSEDLVEVHHIDHKHCNNKAENLSLLHKHCHDIIHGRCA